MRIRNQKGKKTEKMPGKWYRYRYRYRNCDFIFLTIKVNLDQLHKEIFNKFVKAGSGSVLKNSWILKQCDRPDGDNAGWGCAESGRQEGGGGCPLTAADHERVLAPLHAAPLEQQAVRRSLLLSARQVTVPGRFVCRRVGSKNLIPAT